MKRFIIFLTVSLASTLSFAPPKRTSHAKKQMKKRDISEVRVASTILNGLEYENDGKRVFYNSENNTRIVMDKKSGAIVTAINNAKPKPIEKRLRAPKPKPIVIMGISHVGYFNPKEEEKAQAKPKVQETPETYMGSLKKLVGSLIGNFWK